LAASATDLTGKTAGGAESKEAAGGGGKKADTKSTPLPAPTRAASLGACLVNVAAAPADELADFIVAAAKASTADNARAVLRRLRQSSRAGLLIVASTDEGDHHVLPLVGITEHGPDTATSSFYGCSNDSVAGAMPPPVKILPEWIQDFADAEVPGIAAHFALVEQ